MAACGCRKTPPSENESGVTLTTPMTLGGSATLRWTASREPYPARVIDLHSHVLPGVDDGARTIEDSRELASKAASEGITAIAATPHVRHDYPTTPDRMEAEVAALRRDFSERGVRVDILHGGEIDLEAMRALSQDDLRRFTTAQSGRYLLVEFPYRGWPLDLEQTLFELALSGIAPILAHPERNAEVQAEPGRRSSFVERGGLVQITAASLDGRIGRRSRQAAQKLIEQVMPTSWRAIRISPRSERSV